MWLLRVALVIAIIAFVVDPSVGHVENWHKPGCHKVGNTRKIQIPDCVEFTITTNACRGFCESYSMPAIPHVTTNTMKPAKPVLSIGQCCNMMESEEVIVELFKTKVIKIKVNFFSDR